MWRAHGRLAATALLLACLAAGPAAGQSGHEPCTVCHLDMVGPGLIAPEPALCIDCHSGRAAAAEHRIDVLQREPVWPPLPLRDGRLTCITCHDEHVYEGAMLRVSRRDLCTACHRF